MSGLLSGKVALISGAAAGIGAAVTRRFAEEGATLWINDIRPEALDVLVAGLAGDDVQVTATAGDASDPSFVGSWVAAAVERHGRIDVLYNNVGVSRPGLIGDTSDEDWRFQQRMTLDTAFFATRAVLPHMMRQRGGSIVSMSSGPASGATIHSAPTGRPRRGSSI